MGFGIDKEPRRGVAFYSIDFRTNAVVVDASRSTEVGGRWPNGVIPYYVPSTLDGNFVKDVRNTMARWEECIRVYAGRVLVKFVEVDANASSSVGATGSAAVKIVDNDSRADIGYLQGRAQKAGVDIKKDVKLLTSLPHELGHCIGLAHEHERADAAAEVKSYVQTKVGGDALAANSNAKYVTLGTAFDQFSIMMYPTEALKILNETDAANGRRGGCVISKKQIADMNWCPSQGDLEYIRLLYS
jgi:predicted Zn-dependent protease